MNIIANGCGIEGAHTLSFGREGNPGFPRLFQFPFFGTDIVDVCTLSSTVFSLCITVKSVVLTYCFHPLTLI